MKFRLVESKDKSMLDKNFMSATKIDYKIISTDLPEWKIKYSNLFPDIDNKASSKVIFVLAIDTNNNLCGIIQVKKQVKGKNIISGFRVFDKYKGQGIGKDLFKYAINKLDGNYLGVFDDNKVAINLYKQFGFREVSDKKYSDGDRVIFMQK